MYLIYSILFSVGVVLMAPFYWWRKGRVQGRGHWAERFGNIPFNESERGAIWIHAVSLGETLAAAGLVQEVQAAYPTRKIYLSHVTPTGREAGEKRLPSIAGRFYAPLDWSWTVRRAMDRIRPSLLIIVETEIWPNLFRVAKQSGARVVIVNARMSNRSFRGYSFVRPFMRSVLSNLDEIYAQTEQDAEHFRQLVPKPEQVRMAGNLKFDARPPQLGEFARALRVAIQQARRGPILVAASTMPGEEPLVLEAWDQITKQYPTALLILAPRHPARFDEISKELSRDQREHIRRTNLLADVQTISQQLKSTGILLLDTIGELAGVFEVADLVFVGGSLVPTGGHNILEPAYWSKVIAFGPHMENFRDIAKLFLDAGAAIQVRNPQELAHAAWLLQTRDARESMGVAAKKVLDTNSGATARTLEGLRKYLDSAPLNKSPVSTEAK
jgi:3-deoxy-D-manno-octulosonic-acid transferase